MRPLTPFGDGARWAGAAQEARAAIVDAVSGRRVAQQTQERRGRRWQPLLLLQPRRCACQIVKEPRLPAAGTRRAFRKTRAARKTVRDGFGKELAQASIWRTGIQCPQPPLVLYKNSCATSSPF